MPITDITPIGAYINAIEAANTKDRAQQRHRRMSQSKEPRRAQTLASLLGWIQGKGTGRKEAATLVAGGSTAHSAAAGE